MSHQHQRDYAMWRNVLLTILLPPLGVIADSIDLYRGIRRRDPSARLVVVALLLLLAVYLTIGLIIGTFHWTETRIEYGG